MFRHGPSRLKGPLSRDHAWRMPAVPDAPHAPAVPPQPDSAGEGKRRGKGRRRADAPIRTELVERVRREIAEGVYETPEKMEAALRRLLEEMEGE